MWRRWGDGDRTLRGSFPRKGFVMKEPRQDDIEAPTAAADGAGQDEAAAAAAAGFSRRGFLRGLGGSLAATDVGTGILTGRPDGPGASAEAAESEAQGGAAGAAVGTLPVSLTVNGQ